MSNPRIEEVSDDDDIASDPDEMDLDSFDFARPKGTLQPSTDPTNPDTIQAMLQAQTEPQPTSTRSQQTPQQISDRDRERLQREHKEKTKAYQCIYPLYFDASRSREDGRRVKKENAVPNPLARELVDALQEIGKTLAVALQIVFEPSKCHPKDWANPGRVRVLVKTDGRPVTAKVQSKHHLYILISAYLKSHPTTEESPMRLQLQGLPMPKDGGRPPPAAVPRGFKIGGILPLHSPALSGGGVSDNFLKDMMAEMGGELPEGMKGMGNMAAGGGKPKQIRVGKGKK